MDFPHEVRFFAGIGPAHFPAETTRPLGQGCLPFSPYFECCRYAQNLTKYNLKIFQVRIARFYIRFLKDFERSDHWAEVVCHFHPTFNIVAPLKISQNII